MTSSSAVRAGASRTWAKEKKVGFLAAFEGIPKPARKPSKPTQPPSVSIVGARLDGIDVTFIQTDWGLALHDVHAIGGLAFKGKTFTWEVTDAEFRAGGRLRILGEKAGSCCRSSAAASIGSRPTPKIRTTST